MIIECLNCNKKFNLDEKLIPENGRALKCSSCDHIWHYKITTIKNVDDLVISEDKNANLDTSISEVEKKEDKHNEKINDEYLIDINQGVLSEDKIDDEEDKKDEIEEDEIKDEIDNEEKQGKIKVILVYFIVVIISLLGLIFLLDSFRFYLSSVFPVITPLFDSFYETLLDFKLFIKDLTN